MCAIHKSSCFSRCLRVPIAMRRFYKHTLCILETFRLTNPHLHHGLLGQIPTSAADHWLIFCHKADEVASAVRAEVQ